MGHNILTNTTGKPINHPDTGQLIMPGQMYAELDEEGKKALEKANKAAEKALAKNPQDTSDDTTTTDQQV